MKTKIILATLCGMVFLHGCGENNSDQHDSQVKSFNVSTKILEGEGSIGPSKQSIREGLTATFNITPQTNYKIALASGCNGKLVENTYITGKINSDCRIDVKFALSTPTEIASELQVTTEIKAYVKDLSEEWDKKVNQVDETTLVFAGIPKLVTGDVFIVNETAYKVIKVLGDSIGNTMVTVTEPTLDEVYERIELNGSMEALEFIPNPELFDEQQAKAKLITAKSSSITANTKDDGFQTVQLSMSKDFKPYPISSTGSLKIGAKADFKKWEVLSNTGEGLVDIYLQPSFLLSLNKSVETGKDYNQGLCSSRASIRKEGRVYLGAIPLGKAIAAMPSGHVLSTLININIPVCLPINISTNMSFDVLKLSGKYQAQVKLGSSQTPEITDKSNLNFEVPPSSSKISSTTLDIEANHKYTLDVDTEVGFEVGFEVDDRLGKYAHLGVNLAALFKPSFQGNFGVNLVGSNFSNIVASPDACITLSLLANIENKAFLKTFGDKQPLKITWIAPIPGFESINKSWGLCKSNQYIKISSTGKHLPDNEKEWSCVLDTKTGLMWEDKTASGLRSYQHRYSWYEDNNGVIDPSFTPDPNNPVEYCGKTISKCNTRAFVQAINTQRLCGYNDWRLPIADEVYDIGVDETKRVYFKYYDDHSNNPSNPSGTWVSSSGTWPIPLKPMFSVYAMFNLVKNSGEGTDMYTTEIMGSTLSGLPLKVRLVRNNKE